jgi:hypothetical protein
MSEMYAVDSSATYCVDSEDFDQGWECGCVGKFQCGE